MEDGEQVKELVTAIALPGLIAIGVIMGNLGTDAIQSYQLQKRLEQRNAEREIEQAAARDRQRKQAAITKDRIKAKIISQQRDTDRQTQLNRTCDFWLDQYSKTGKQSDKNHRDTACKDAGRAWIR